MATKAPASGGGVPKARHPDAAPSGSAGHVAEWWVQPLKSVCKNSIEVMEAIAAREEQAFPLRSSCAGTDECSALYPASKQSTRTWSATACLNMLDFSSQT